MENKTEITIVMGTYNPEKKRLDQAVHSMMRQTFPYWELLLYDDGSDDTFSKAVRAAAALDKRIVYIRSERNRGLSHALNECLRRAEGRYIARMDDDDIARKDRLKKQYDFLEAHPEYQWVGSDAVLIDQHGIWGYQKMPEIPDKRDFLFNSPYIHPTVMFRREVFIKNGGYSTARCNLGNEDYELFMRLHRNGCQGYNLPEPLLQYREDSASYRRRTYQRRVREMKLRYRGFRDLGILKNTGFFYVLKPLIAGAIPPPVHHYIQWKRKGILPVKGK